MRTFALSSVTQRGTGTGLPAERRRRTRRTGRRGGRAGAEETAPERPLAAARSSPQSDPLRHGSRGRQRQPVEHPPRSPSAGLVWGPTCRTARSGSGEFGLAEAAVPTLCRSASISWSQPTSRFEIDPVGDAKPLRRLTSASAPASAPPRRWFEEEV